MKVVYVAGPFTGVDGWEIACNVHEANKLAREVARLGAAPLTPHAIGAQFSGTETAEYWYAATLELLRRCDAVIFVDGWEKSKGARGEHEEAMRRGLCCFYGVHGLAGLKRWLGGGRKRESADSELERTER